MPFPEEDNRPSVERIPDFSGIIEELGNYGKYDVKKTRILKSGDVVPVLGFGIGSVYQADVWRFN